MATKADTPTPRRPRPSSRELRCGICAQPYTYPLKGQNSTRRLCAACALLPSTVSESLLRMGGRIRELEQQLKTLTDKVNNPTQPPNGVSP